MIRFCDIRMTLGQRRILDVPSLAIEQGRLTVLSGSNGAGKTTLLKIFAGLLQPDHALVTVDGLTRPWKRARAGLREQVVYLHQQPYLFRTSVEKNVAYGLKRAGLTRTEIAKRVGEAMKWADLDHFATQDARCLSGGEMQRLALTRARVLSPKFLLLDEPCSNMDQEHRKRTYQLLQDLCAEGIGLVLTNHEPSLFAKLADAHLHLNQGRLVAQEGGVRHGQISAPGKVTPLRSRKGA